MIDAEAKADARVLELLVNGDRRTLLAWPAGPISSDAPAGDRLAGCLVDSLTRGASGPDSRARALGLALLRAERELSRAKSAAASRAALEAPDVAELEDKLRSVMAQSAQTEAKLADAQRRLLEKDSSAERAKQWASGDANAAKSGAEDARVHIRELGTELGHAQQLNAQQADTIRSQAEHLQMLQRALDEAEAQLRTAQEDTDRRAVEKWRATSTDVDADGEGARAASVSRTEIARTPETSDNEMGALLLLERGRREAIESELLSLKVVSGRQVEAQKGAVERALLDLESQVADRHIKLEAANYQIAQLVSARDDAVRERDEADSRIEQETQFRERAEGGWERSQQRAVAAEREVQREAAKVLVAEADALTVRQALQAAEARVRQLDAQLEGRISEGNREAAIHAASARDEGRRVEGLNVQLQLAAREAEVRLEAAVAAQRAAEARSHWEGERARLTMQQEEGQRVHVVNERTHAVTTELGVERRAREEVRNHWRAANARQQGAYEHAKGEVNRQFGALKASVDVILNNFVRASAVSSEIGDWVRSAFELKSDMGQAEHALAAAVTSLRADEDGAAGYSGNYVSPLYNNAKFASPLYPPPGGYSYPPQPPYIPSAPSPPLPDSNSYLNSAPSYLQPQPPAVNPNLNWYANPSNFNSEPPLQQPSGYGNQPPNFNFEQPSNYEQMQQPQQQPSNNYSGYEQAPQGSDPALLRNNGQPGFQIAPPTASTTARRNSPKLPVLNLPAIDPASRFVTSQAHEVRSARGNNNNGNNGRGYSAQKPTISAPPTSQGLPSARARKVAAAGGAAKQLGKTGKKAPMSAGKDRFADRAKGDAMMAHMGRW